MCSHLCSYCCWQARVSRLFLISTGYEGSTAQKKNIKTKQQMSVIKILYRAKNLKEIV